MKKVLALMLSAIMIMSLFFVIPASAAEGSRGKYYFNDFEDGSLQGVISGNSMPEAASVVDGGYGDSAKAMKWVGGATGGALGWNKYVQIHSLNAWGIRKNWSIEPNETITISMKAKFTSIGSKTEGTNFNLGISVEKVDNVPVLTLLSEDTAIKYKKDVWQEHVLVYKNTSGSTVKPTSVNGDIGCQFDFNWSFGAGEILLIDDVEIKVEAAEDTNKPSVSQLSTEIGNNTVVYDYEFTSPISAKDASVIKLKYGDTVIASCLTGETLRVPTAYRERKGMYIEVVPIDSNGNIGKSVDCDVSDASAYFVTNFEDGETKEIGPKDGYTVAICNDGVGETKKSLAVSATEGGYPRFNVALREGYSYDISMWLKATDVSGQSAFLIFNQIKQNTLEYTPIEIPLTIDGSLTSGDWVYASATITNFNGSVNGETVLPRGYMMLKVGSGAVSYQVDDLTVMPREYYKVATSDEICGYMNSYTFESGLVPNNGTDLEWNPNAEGWDTAGFGKEIGQQTTPVTIAGETLGDSTNNDNYIKLTYSKTYQGTLRQHGLNIQNGVKYYVSFWAKAENEAAIGKSPYLFTINKYYNEDGTTSSKQVDLSKVAVTDIDGTRHTSTSEFGLTNEWRRYEYSLTRRWSNVETGNMYMGFRIGADSREVSASFTKFNITQENKNYLQIVAESEANKTSDSTYYLKFSSGIVLGDVTNTITRLMVPYKNNYVIKEFFDDYKNEGAFEIEATSLDGAKLLVNAKNAYNYFSACEEHLVDIPSSPLFMAITEFDQTVWGTDLGQLTATVYYNNLSGSKTMMALCATYDSDNKLYTSDIQEFTLVNGEGSAKLAMSTADHKAQFARIYLWDKENLAPILGETAEITKTTGANFIYVDYEKGKDSYNGTYLAPYKNIEAALEKHVELSAGAYKDSYIILMPGRHRRTEELYITEEHTANGGKLVITSYDKNMQSEISGGYDLTGKFTNSYGNGIYYAEATLNDLGLYYAPRQLFVNGSKAIKARSEDLTNIKNTTTYKRKNSWNTEIAVDVYGKLESTDLSILNYKRPTDLEFVFGSVWTNHRCQVASIEKSTNSNGEEVVSMTMDELGWTKICDSVNSSGYCKFDSDYNVIETGSYPPRYMENAIELLDEPGEWYYDSVDGRVYYMPRANENINTAEIIIPTLDNYMERLMSVEGTATNKVNNITFDSVTFSHTTWTRPNTVYGHGDGQDNKVELYANPEGAIDISHTNNINITNCKFTKLGISGLRLVKGVKNVNIIGNEFYEIAGGAVALGLTGQIDGSVPETASAGDRDKRYWFRNPKDGDEIDSLNFTNNYIHHVSRDYHGAAAVSIGYPSNSLVAHNEIAFIPYSGIHVGFCWNTRYTHPDGTTEADTGTNLTVDIKNNYFHDLFQGGIYDGGAIYTIGVSGGTADDPNEISGNYTENIGPGGASYYNDQGSTCYEVFNNVTNLKNTWEETCFTTGRHKSESNSININMDATVASYVHHLTWHDNYSTKVNDFVSNYTREDETISVETSILVNDLKSNPVTAAIIENSGIQAEYRNNFRAGLQNMVVIDEITLSVGQTINNTPTYITSKNTVYKRNALSYTVVSSNSDVASADANTITANSKGTAVISYTALENGIYRTVTTRVTVE